MSADRVRTALGQMEAWLADPAWDPDPAALARWNAEFQAGLAQAKLAADWPDLETRAHVAGEALQDRIQAMVVAQDQIRLELEARQRGNRALRGYGENAR